METGGHGTGNADAVVDRCLDCAGAGMSCPTESHNSSVFTGRPLPHVPQPLKDGERGMSCTHNCDQARTCTCCRYLTPDESRRFWRLIWVAAAVDIAVIAGLLWVLR